MHTRHCIAFSVHFDKVFSPSRSHMLPRGLNTSPTDLSAEVGIDGDFATTSSTPLPPVFCCHGTTQVASPSSAQPIFFKRIAAQGLAAACALFVCCSAEKVSAQY
jgi:hypothetical protein